MKKYLTFIVFLMLLSFTFFPSGESASATYSYGFEDSTVTQQVTLSESGFFYSYAKYGGVYGSVDTAHPKTGTKCYQMAESDVNRIAYFNFSTGVINVGSNISFWLYVCDDDVTSINAHIVEFSFFNYNDVEIIRLWIETESTVNYQFGYNDHDSKEDLSLFAQESHVKVGFNFVDNDSVIYWCGDTSASSTPKTVSDVSNISYMKMTTFYEAWALDYGRFWIDDFVVTTEEQISEDECDYSYMPDRYSYIGSINSGCSRQSNMKTIETRYNIPVDMDITCVDLAVSSDQYSDDPDLSNYLLTFNGFDMGNPSCFIEYSYYYILRWEIDVELTNDIAILEFTHSEKTNFGRYWQVVTGCYSNTDLDNDGEVNFKESTTPDGIYNGQIWNWDLAYQMYYENIQFPDDETYFDNDYIYVTNETLYCGTPVWLTYMLTSMATDTYVRIWNDDTAIEVDDGTFPYTCPTTSETIGFVAETSANYTAKLYRNSVELDNDSFFVNDFQNPTNYVYTMPNPCYEGKSYLVKYAYDNTDDYDGAIFLSNTPDYRNYYEIFYVLDGNTGSYTQLINAPCTLYYILAVNKNSTYYVVDNGIHQHTIKSKLMKNYFTLGNDNLALVDGKVTQSISGETTHMGGNCRIYDNDKLVYTITESTFNEFYTVTTTGNHKVEMRLITNETTVLYAQNYTVSGVSVDDEIEDTSYILRDWVFDLYGDMGVFLTGVLFVIGFMFIPFALVLGVNVKYNKNIALGDIHWSTYLIFAIIGVIVDVQLHLAELWIILLVCVVAIAITVITWKGNR